MSKLSKLIEALKAIGRGVSFGAKKSLSFVEWLETKLLGSGGGGEVPAYTPTSSRAGMASALQEARVAAAVPSIDPGGIALTKKFCKATETERETMDLSFLPSEARFMLLTMDEHELKSLGQAGPGQVRKFLVGKEHGLHGVPVVGVHVPPTPTPVKPRSVSERIAWQTEALKMKPRHSAAFRSPR